jgi:hypothetical protein
LEVLGFTPTLGQSGVATLILDEHVEVKKPVILDYVGECVM